MRRRTETRYKAEEPGEAAQHVEALDSGSTVDRALVQRQFTFLFGEACSAQPSTQCIDDSSETVPADSDGMTSYSAVECVGDGNIVDDGAGVSRRHSTIEDICGCFGELPERLRKDSAGRPEQEGREAPRLISQSTLTPDGDVDLRRHADHGTRQDDLLEQVLSRENMARKACLFWNVLGTFRYRQTLLATSSINLWLHVPGIACERTRELPESTA